MPHDHDQEEAEGAVGSLIESQGGEGVKAGEAESPQRPILARSYWVPVASVPYRLVVLEEGGSLR